MSDLFIRRLNNWQTDIREGGAVFSPSRPSGGRRRTWRGWWSARPGRRRSSSSPDPAEPRSAWSALTRSGRPPPGGSPLTWFCWCSHRRSGGWRQKLCQLGARRQTKTKERRYHGVHGEVVVLSLQLGGVLVAAADLRVALQEHLLVVADPVEHLQKQNSQVRVEAAALARACSRWGRSQMNGCTQTPGLQWADGSAPTILHCGASVCLLVNIYCCCELGGSADAPLSPCETPTPLLAVCYFLKVVFDKNHNREEQNLLMQFQKSLGGTKQI